MELLTYPYEHLGYSEEGHQFIRILVLYPSASFGDELKCKLVDECLCESSNTYEALSYTWGSEEAVHTLFIDGWPHSIRPNLFSALKRLREAAGDSGRRLWIDAPCIDQQDDGERSRSVAIMRQIFGNARRVLAWLGEDTPDGSVQLCFDMFRRYDGHMENLPRPVPDRLERYNGVEAEPCTAAKLDWLTNATAVLMRRPWFFRRWIVQEIAVSEANAIVLCGRSSIEWQLFRDIARHALDGRSHDNKELYGILSLRRDTKYDLLVCSPQDPLNQPTGVARGGLSAVRKFINGVSSNKHYDSPSSYVSKAALWTLDQFHDFDCSDGRDRIAALNGLQGVWIFDIDHAESVEDNYVAFAAACIRSRAVVPTLLAAVQRRQSDAEEERRLPSWVPDWRLPVVASRKRLEDPMAYKTPRVRISGARLLIMPRETRLMFRSEFQLLHQTKCSTVSYERETSFDAGDPSWHCSADNIIRELGHEYVCLDSFNKFPTVDHFAPRPQKAVSDQWRQADPKSLRQSTLRRPSQSITFVLRRQEKYQKTDPIYEIITAFPMLSDVCAMYRKSFSQRDKRYEPNHWWTSNVQIDKMIHVD